MTILSLICFRTYERGCDRDHSSLKTGLHDGSVEALDGLGESVEIGREETVRREVLFQNIEELHQSGGDELGVGEVGSKGHLGR